MIRRVAAMSNSTSSYSESSGVLDICKISRELKDPSGISTSMSLAALITTGLQCPFAVFLNGLALLAFYKNPCLRKQANVFLIALTLVDLISSLLASPSLIFIEVRYQKRLQTSCFLNFFFMNAGLFLPRELLLTALNCERFISMKYPIWHRAHVTKRHLIKIAVACCILGACVTLVRAFTDKAEIPFVVFLVCTWVTMFIFAVLTWWAIKRRRKSKIQPTHLQKQTSQSVRQQASEEVQVPRLNVPENSISEISLAKPVECSINLEQGPSKEETEEETDSQEQHLPENTKEFCRRSVCNTQEQANFRADELSEGKPYCIRITQSVRKACKLAIYLGMGLVLTRLVPLIIFSLPWFRSIDGLSAIIKALPLLTSLLNPAIYIGMNEEIRKGCLKLLKIGKTSHISE